MSESGGMSVNCLTAGGQNVATDVKGNITTLPANLRPAGATTALNLTWESDNKLRSADIDANGTADVHFQYDALGRRVARTGTGGSVVYVQMDQQTIADYPVGGAATTPTFRYVYASYIDEPVVRKTAGTGGTLVYFHRNQQYSVTAVTTSTGTIAERYAYSAYGQPTVFDASGAVLQTSNFSIHTSYTGRECLAGACGISGSISMPGNGFTPFRYDFCKEYNCTRWSDPVVCFGKSKRVCFEHEDFCTFYWRHANNGTVPPEPKANEF